MEVVAGALLSASVESMFNMLGSSELLKFAQEKKIHPELKKWETTLRRINGLLHDAEEKQLTDKGVKIWLLELQNLAYDIEDVLDEFATETLKRKVMKDSHTSTEKLHKLISSCTDKLQKLVSSCSCSFAFKRKMASGIEDITARLEDSARQEQSLNLLTNASGSGTRANQLKERPPTTSLEEPYIYGRDDEKEAIVQMLLSDEDGNNSISVIPIVGMGGIGKTTLARSVYNNSKIEENFNIKIWICVSENFDVIGLTRTILRKVAPGTRDLNNLDLDLLQKTLKEKLYKKKFLLILDDVWEEDYSLWDQLRRPFFFAASSSKIVVTTRNINVAPITIAGDVSMFHVKELPDDDCLMLLSRHALAAHSFDAHLDLKDIGRELVKRCNGLPLAVKVLGGLLRNKPSREQWERVLRNKWWNSPENSNSVYPTLKLSYDDLPSHLKRCFVFCAIFPKDYEFDKDELVSLWMAEGFLHHPQRGKQMEDLGNEYFENLVSRSFFQSSVGNQSRRFIRTRSLFDATKSTRSVFVMHDLISDIAQTIAEDICYNCDNKIEVDMSSSKYEKIRHASFSFLTNSQEYEVYSRMKRLRTIWRRPGPYHDWGVYGNKMLEELSTQSKSIRVLSLAHSPTKKLSNSIGDLIHLRFINLSGSHIQQLPESVSTLFNLQTLLLNQCIELEKLPDEIRNLVNLHHLDISWTNKLRKIPFGIGMLTNLQTLKKFIVEEGDETTIAELKNLNNLRGSLIIEGLENVQDAKSANLKGKQGLEELELKWSSRHGRNDMSVLESLKPPHQNLKRLTISCYGGAEFPSWMTNNHLFSKLTSLDLLLCGETILLPPLGQLCSLKELRINGLKAVKTIGGEFYGNGVVSFPSLERLEISYMSEWIEWSNGNMGGEVFPNLQELRISYCTKLIGSLPSGLHRLRNLSELKIMECGSLVSFPPMGLPCSLKRIHVVACDALQCFPIIYTDNSEQSLLEELHIEGCSALKYFERNFKLPTSLKKLIIWECRNLLSLPDGLMVQDDNTNHLEHLEIVGCQGLTCLPTGKFPAALKILEIGGPLCMQLESAISENNTTLVRIGISDNNDLKALPSIDCLQSLRILSISDCPALESFPEMGFFSTTLQVLGIYNCQNLSLVPIRMQSHFPSLGKLSICHNNLRQPIAEWGLGMLSSLKRLHVTGRCPATEDVVSFPDDNCCWLPTTLKSLFISDFVSLESVSMGLQMLTFLEQLSINDCPKLQSLPKDALPSSVNEVIIRLCPLLNAHYLENRGEYSSIVHVIDI